jgi:pilus assembly protein CpaB
MNRRVLTILLIAFIIAVAAASLVVKLVHGTLMAANNRAPATTHVIAASNDIKLGTILADSDLTTIEIAGSLPPGAIVDKKNVIGRGVVSDLFKGEPIMDSRLAPMGAGGGLAAGIPNGMRACAVKVDDVSSVSGFSTPGTRVDVLVSGTPPGATDQSQGTVVKTILQDIKVLSAGTDIQKDSEGKPKQVQVVNLLVTPDQAETLSLASSQAQIRLVLRNPLDTQTAELPGNYMGNVFDGGKPKVPVAVHHVARKKAPDVDTVEVFNGSKANMEKFSAPEGKQ